MKEANILAPGQEEVAAFTVEHVTQISEEGMSPIVDGPLPRESVNHEVKMDILVASLELTAPSAAQDKSDVLITNYPTFTSSSHYTK